MNKRERDIFDDLDALKAQRPDAARVPIDKIMVPAGGRRTEPFGMIPLSAAKRIGGFTCVLVHIAHQMVLSGGKPVPATVARTGCKDYKTRVRTLHLLEELGIAEIEWLGNGKAPLIKNLFDR